MKIISYFTISIIAYSCATIILSFHLPNFFVTLSVNFILAFAGALSLFVFFSRLLLKTILKPLVFLTFGFIYPLLTAFFIILLDFISPIITINSISSTIFSAISFSLIALIINLNTKLK